MRHNLFYGIFRFLDHAARAREIAADPERKSRSMRYGVFAIVMALCVPACALLIYFSLKGMSGEAALLLIFWIALLAIGIGGVLVFFVNSLAFWILQCCINRKAITWISLVVLLLSLAAAVYIIVLSL